MWTVLEGNGEVAVDRRLVQVTAGDVVRIHPEQWHAIRARDKLAFIEVQRGSEVVEHDIVRRYHTWAGRVWSLRANSSLVKSGLFPELDELTGNLIPQATFFPMFLELRVLYAFTEISRDRTWM